MKPKTKKNQKQKKQTNKLEGQQMGGDLKDIP